MTESVKNYDVWCVRHLPVSNIKQLILLFKDEEKGIQTEQEREKNEKIRESRNLIKVINTKAMSTGILDPS